MKLNMIKRNAQCKSETNRLRREGYIPAIMYHNGKAGEAVAVKNNEYLSLIRNVKQGHLSTQKITLVCEGKEKQVIIKEIQYHPTTYKVLHLDFEELDANVPVNVKVPIECVGVVDCVGVKLGGFIRQMIRHMKVRCLPRDIPETFVVDIANLGLDESRRLGDLNIPKTIRPLVNLKEVAVAVGRQGAKK